MGSVSPADAAVEGRPDPVVAGRSIAEDDAYPSHIHVWDFLPFWPFFISFGAIFSIDGEGPESLDWIDSNRSAGEGARSSIEKDSNCSAGKDLDWKEIKSLTSKGPELFNRRVLRFLDGKGLGFIDRKGIESLECKGPELFDWRLIGLTDEKGLGLIVRVSRFDPARSNPLIESFDGNVVQRAMR